MSPEQDFVSAKASTKPWSHLRGVEEISPEVPLSFGIRRVWNGSCESLFYSFIDNGLQAEFTTHLLLLTERLDMPAAIPF